LDFVLLQTGDHDGLVVEKRKDGTVAIVVGDKERLFDRTGAHVQPKEFGTDTEDLEATQDVEFKSGEGKA
jgi:hypothetical protein